MLRMFSYPRRPKSGQITCYLNRTYHVLTTYRDPQVDNLLLSLYRSADSLPIRDRPSRSKPLIDSPSWAYVFARGGCFVPRLMFPTVPVPSGVPSRSIWERLYQR